MKTELAAKTIRDLLDYDPENGFLTWKPRGREWFDSDRICKSWNTQFSRKPAFTAINSKGYNCGAILGKLYFAHRIAWAHFYGRNPDHQIDHINQERTDNRIENLREVLSHINQKNMTLSANNTSGVTGVYWDSRLEKWTVRLGFNNKRLYFGVFTFKEDAVAARKAAEQKYGFHPNHGRARNEILGNNAANGNHLVVSTAE